MLFHDLTKIVLEVHAWELRIFSTSILAMVYAD